MAETLNITLGPIPRPDPRPSLLHGLKGNPLMCSKYVDDINLGGPSLEAQFQFLEEELFPRLAWANLTLSFKKIVLFTSKVKALGIAHEVGGVIRVLPDRVKKIANWPEPRTQRQVRSFLGAIQITRRWVKNFAEMARPLQKLTGKDPWRWGIPERLSFQLLTTKCATAAKSFGLDPNLQVIMYTDASQFGAGMAITQV